MKTHSSNRRGLYVNLNEEEHEMLNKLRKKHFLNISGFVKQCLKDKFDEMEKNSK